MLHAESPKQLHQPKDMQPRVALALLVAHEEVGGARLLLASGRERDVLPAERRRGTQCWRVADWRCRQSVSETVLSPTSEASSSVPRGLAVTEKDEAAVSFSEFVAAVLPRETLLAEENIALQCAGGFGAKGGNPTSVPNS